MTYWLKVNEIGSGYCIVDDDGSEVDISRLGQITMKTTGRFSDMQIECEPPEFIDDPMGAVAQAMQLRDAMMPEGRIVIDTIRIVSKYDNDW